MFLNGNLTEEIYMIQPKGFVVKELEQQVCKLVRSLYGMKQAPNMWHEEFDKVIKSSSDKVNDANKCGYTKFIDKQGVIICLYVDDMVIFGTDTEAVKDTMKFLLFKFNIKDMGLANVILGIKIVSTTKGCTLT